MSNSDTTTGAASEEVYDVALSYAGEDRTVAREIADFLDESGYRVFFDEYEKPTLWGEDLSEVLGRIYGEASRYCVLFISRHYAEKPWTNHERQFVLARAMNERRAYILPIRLDDTQLPGLPPTIGCLDWGSCTQSEVCELLVKKVGQPMAVSRGSPVDPSTNRIREVLAACYRRAVFTRCHAQLNQEAMFASLSECRAMLQQLAVYVEPEEAHRLVAGIIGELDLIERKELGGLTTADENAMAFIDGAKLRIISALLELAEIGDIPFEMPIGITEEVFHSEEEARSPPQGPQSLVG